MSNNFGGFVGEMNRAISEVKERIKLALEYTGEAFVRDCRLQPGYPETAHGQGFYADRTGNLRNSIGYYLYEDGNCYDQSDTNSDDENKRNLEAEMPKQGIFLGGIAGMNYASYVEAKGYNVISIQTIAAQKSIEEFNEDLKVFLNG